MTEPEFFADVDLPPLTDDFSISRRQRLTWWLTNRWENLQYYTFIAWRLTLVVLCMGLVLVFS